MRAQRAERAERGDGPGRVILIAAIISLVVLIGVGVWQTLALNSLWILLRSGFWIYAILIVVGVVTFIVAIRNRVFGSGDVLVSGLVFVACVISIIGIGSHQGYQAQRGMYLASITIKNGALGEYQQRPPLTVAQNQTQSHVDINGTMGGTSYVPSEGKYGTLVATKGMFVGYGEVVWQTVNDSGQSTATNCQFSAAGARVFNGLFWSNLQRAIIHKAGPELINQNDAYGYCDTSGNPVLIVPLKTYRGIIYTYQVPDGVAVIDKDWNITIDRDVTTGKYPGPVYPESLAAHQREATAALGTWWDHVQGRVGYAQTNDNYESNISEFNLERGDGSGSDFVTPLTLAGESQSINAVGVVESSQNIAGQLNPYTVLTLTPPRQANSAMDDRLRADYGYLTAWAAGMWVYEIVPTGNDTWRATLGMPKAIMYYAEIAADGTSCLYSVGDGSKVGCSGDTNTNQTTNTSDTIDLTTMTDSQLLQLIQDAARQLQENQQAGR